MRAIADSKKITEFLKELAAQVQGSGRIFLVGGATAVLHGWRSTTIDVDLKAEPEPQGFFEAIALLKDRLDINVELASPDLFIPALPGWQDRSPFISRIGKLDFFHFDPYSQVLSKIERNHPRDLVDANEMVSRKMVDPLVLEAMFLAIEPQLPRFPAIDPKCFRSALDSFLSNHAPNFKPRNP